MVTTASTTKTTSASRRGLVERRVDGHGRRRSHDRQPGVRQVGEHAEAGRAERGEREVALGRGRGEARQDHDRERPDGEAGQQRPVDEREIGRDLLGGHGRSVAVTPPPGRPADNGRARTQRERRARGRRLRWRSGGTRGSPGSATPGSRSRRRTARSCWSTRGTATPTARAPSTRRSGATSCCVTHGHFDHFDADSLSLARRLHPSMPCVHELSLYLIAQLGDAAEVIGMNAGGTVETHGVRVTMVPAAHSSGDLMGGTRRALLRGAGRVRARARERLPDLRRRRHHRVRRHGADPRAVRARPGDPADRRPLHDGPRRGGGRRRPPGGPRRPARPLGDVPDPDRDARRPWRPSSAPAGSRPTVHDWKPGETVD